MKTLLSPLLLTIAGFLQLSELNASESIRRCPSRQVPRVAPNIHAGPDAEGAPHETVRYGDTFISLWLDSRDSRKVVKADYADNFVPNGSYCNYNDFFVKLINVGRWKVVGYLRTNGKLFGVRAPNRRPQRHDVEPTSSRWYIIHFSRAYRVTVDPDTQRPLDICLHPENRHTRPGNQVGLQTTLRNFGNVHFIIFYSDVKGVLGAELNPAYHHPQVHAD